MQKNKAAFLFALLFAGCAAGPDYRPPAPSVPPEWSRLDEVGMSHAPGDLARWWASFGDPLLTALVTEAERAHPDLTLALAKLRQARAQRIVSGAAQWPELSAAASANRSDTSSQTGSGLVRKLYRAELDASWELDLFGAVRRSVEAAEAEVASAQANLAATRVSLAAETAAAYVDVRNFQNRLNIARDNLARQQDTLTLTEWRARAGLVSSQDVEQARANVEQTRAQIPVLEQNLAAAEDRLALLVAQPVAVLRARLQPVRPLPPLPEHLAVGIPADTLRQRPDVAAAERALAAATARVGVAEAARWPRLVLSGTLGVEAFGASALADPGSGFSTLLAQLTAPLFDAAKRRAQVEVQDALREQAEAQYRKTVLTALSEVEDALAAIAAARRREASLAVAAEAARNAALLARHRYQAGLIDFQSVLDTERSQLGVEDALATARADRLSSLIRLYKALGGGWNPSQQENTP
ncbi:efflux transporter outer membrane subunit [Thiobacter aerophilum]|uniref:Efflux transporter outer membrane subunit n=1 Tax=Thiobacter aerophilum TaxID=3121275 RepID=A0ABV0EB99_9BURK